MDCDRFVRLVKDWYTQVMSEALAPARMVSLMEKHVSECDVCLGDPLIDQNVEKIVKIVMPPTKNVKLAKLGSPKPSGPSDEDLEEIETEGDECDTDEEGEEGEEAEVEGDFDEI